MNKRITAVIVAAVALMIPGIIIAVDAIVSTAR
jgi:UPF0716 family protein affecting phage T7 exclusion